MPAEVALRYGTGMDWKGALGLVKRCAIILIVAGSAVALAMRPCAALVGPAREGDALEAHAIMVLKRASGSAAFCSGVVVARNAVLTAAHCVSGAADTRLHFRDSSGKPVLLPVAAIAIHPGFRPNAPKTRERSIDLALVRAAAPLPERFSPASLEESRIIAIGDRFRIGGYGVTTEGAAQSSGVFRTGALAARAPLSSILLWANDPTGAGTGACTGDSGGPIFAEARDSVVAITSWSEGAGREQCGTLTQGALVAPQRSWIDGVLSRWAAER